MEEKQIFEHIRDEINKILPDLAYVCDLLPKELKLIISNRSNPNRLSFPQIFFMADKNGRLILVGETCTSHYESEGQDFSYISCKNYTSDRAYKDGENKMIVNEPLIENVAALHNMFITEGKGNNSDGKFMCELFSNRFYKTKSAKSV